ncbi:hypothetical protein IQ268_29425 [Oculatella sp. LEGE 06141]|uniref:hypothetical protein n=1 Tax=Oculatella sp. LEGE 06141 TaxID=1828648 RepID=UPI00187F8AC4|nr:hypothetical protein [Oculatella sp. LEGE 06141]MBE9182663.1 hypothetical protein [Oculatella sp. LEGE 06141]
MNDLDQQIQVLIDQAPQDGTTPAAIAAIAPALKAIANQLNHAQYYVLQTLEQNWVMTTLSNRTQPDLAKNVIYAFPTLKDVTSGPHSVKDPQLVALPIPVTHILFQLIAIKAVDSVVFFETSGNTNAGTEVNRDDLQNLIKLYLQQSRDATDLPPNIA